MAALPSQLLGECAPYVLGSWRTLPVSVRSMTEAIDSLVSGC